MQLKLSGQIKNNNFVFLALGSVAEWTEAFALTFNPDYTGKESYQIHF